MGGSYPNYLTNVNGTLFFNAYTNTNGDELWKSDGTEAGTVMAEDICLGISGSYPMRLMNIDGKLFFSADNCINGVELWLYNTLCAELPFSDLNKDCTVDFLDFAIMTSEWLTCNLSPPDLCWE